MHAGTLPAPPVNRITDTCKNITLPQLRCGRYQLIKIFGQPQHWMQDVHDYYRHVYVRLNPRLIRWWDMTVDTDGPPSVWGAGDVLIIINWMSHCICTCISEHEGLTQGLYMWTTISLYLYMYLWAWRADTGIVHVDNHQSVFVHVSLSMKGWQRDCTCGQPSVYLYMYLWAWRADTGIVHVDSYQSEMIKWKSCTKCQCEFWRYIK